MSDSVSREEFECVVNQLNFALTLLTKNHNNLCDTIGEKAFEVDIQKELQDRQAQNSLNSIGKGVSDIKKEIAAEVEETSKS